MSRNPAPVLGCVMAACSAACWSAPSGGDGQRYLALTAATGSSCGWGTARSNASVTGTPLRVGALRFDRGIGTHAPAELVFDLGGEYRWLTFYAGVSADMTEAGSITVEVWLDGAKAFDTGLVTVGQEALYVSLPVRGTRELRIVATDAGNGNAADHVVLGNLRVTTGDEAPAPDASAGRRFTEEAGAPPEAVCLWYRRPAKGWFEAVPIGNGRLGAMVFGGVDTERIALDESTLWSGAPDDNVNPEGLGRLAEIRQLFFDGHSREAVDGCARYLLGRKGNYGTHLPLGDLRLDLDLPEGEVARYRRELDLGEGIARQSFRIGDTQFTQEVIASHPDGVIAAHLTADGPQGLSLAVSLDSGSPPSRQTTEGPDTIVMVGQARESVHSDGNTGVAFECRVRVLADGGTVKTEGGAIRVSGARVVTLLVAAHTDFGGAHPRDLCGREIRLASAKSYAAVRRDHVADHGRLFGRVFIDLGGEEALALPTDRRWELLRAGQADPQLAAMLFQYGRYLLMASSREDSPLPANLQGIWNDDRACRMGWTCDYHLDINTQQNYWPAEVANLAECAEPLFRLVESLAESGRRTARDLYGCDGWVTHVFTNPWGYTAPGWGLGWGLHPTGGIWIASHLWDHYAFTGDRRFLAERAYPVLREAAAFFLDYTVEHPRLGWLVTGPSVSPENAYVAPDGSVASEGMGPTCDIVLVRDLFTHCIAAETELGVDADLRQRLRAALAKLPPLQVGKHGQLMEWLEDYEEAIPNHRHTSHLIALFPSDQITPDRTPELARAARATIDRRLSRPDWEDVEWSRANMICFFARLRDGDAAQGSVDMLISRLTGPNLMGFSPGGIAGAETGIWVMDGNTAAAAGIAEMLLQSQHDELAFLPALPSAWPSGSVKGLRARGGFKVDLAWSDGRLAAATIRSRLGRECRVRFEGPCTVSGPSGPVALHKESPGLWSFGTEAGGGYTLTSAAPAQRSASDRASPP